MKNPTETIISNLYIFDSTDQQNETFLNSFLLVCFSAGCDTQLQFLKAFGNNTRPDPNSKFGAQDVAHTVRRFRENVPYIKQIYAAVLQG